MDNTLTEQLNAQLIEAVGHNHPLTTCPHCGRVVPANMADMHASICVRSPEMMARIAAALTSDTPGVGARIVDYRRARAANGAADVTTLLRAFGGTWEDVLAAFGLTVRPPKRRPERTPQQQRMTAQQRESAAIADVAAMEAETRAALLRDYEAAHTFHGYKVRDLSGVTVNGKPCVAIMLR